MQYPFEASLTDIQKSPAPFIDAVFRALQSSFLVLPRGSGFIPYSAFQQAYETLKRHTLGFTAINPDQVMTALQEDALAFVVLRTMLGFTPPELAHLASQQAGVDIPQHFARTLDRQVRINRTYFQNLSTERDERVRAQITVACDLLLAGAPSASEGTLHRLAKADTQHGSPSIKHVADQWVPYAMLLYERFLGRPFAGHRDAVSELVGEVMENAVEEQLRAAGISFRKTKRAEKLANFDQAPDFIIPDEWAPQIVIEAKITEDDGTARDKVTRIQHLAEISQQHHAQEKPQFQVVACIDGRGFGIRREDMNKLLIATQGKVFTLSTLNQLVAHTDLKRFTTTPPSSKE